MESANIADNAKAGNFFIGYLFFSGYSSVDHSII